MEGRWGVHLFMDIAYSNAFHSAHIALRKKGKHDPYRNLARVIVHCFWIMGQVKDKVASSGA